MSIIIRTFFLFLCFMFLPGVNCFATMQTVNLPISLDYPLLQALIINRAFTEQGEKVTLVNELGGCVYLSMAKPRLSEAGGTILLEVEVLAQAGTPIGDNCFNSIDWSGFLVFEQQPYITENWQLAFNTVNTRLLGSNRQPGNISSVLWEMIKPYIHNYINSMTVDLMPSVADVKGFLMPLFPHQIREKTDAMLDSMRPGRVTILPDQVKVSILAEVEDVYDPKAAALTEELSDAQLQQIVSLWESMDSMLSFLVTVLSQDALTQDEQRILTEVLLETRYNFSESLEANDVDQDFVRSQFVTAWQQLSPIFHNHLYKKNGSANLLGYLAFVSASDALVVLDRLGPTFGVEISRNGLVRLMQMMHADPAWLNYQFGPNPHLQELFQLNRESETPETELIQEKPLINSLFDFLSPTEAYAAEHRITMADILAWKVPAHNVNQYIAKVDGLLDVAILKTDYKGLVPQKQQKMFHRLIEALAWQESCFRQFVVQKGKLTYLLSYNKSSVGLMQVNERVWRGIYDRERLRWDIRYNAEAGCEIAAMYLTKYGLRDPAVVKRLKDDQLAGLVYSMYNGGPSQYKKYMERRKTGKMFKSDKLFSQKYDYVVKKNSTGLRKCLIGG